MTRMKKLMELNEDRGEPDIAIRCLSIQRLEPRTARLASMLNPVTSKGANGAFRHTYLGSDMLLTVLQDELRPCHDPAALASDSQRREYEI
jgi:hypothetical protein